MGVFETIRETLSAIDPDRESRSLVGAYWCDDCGVRQPVEAGASVGDSRPCPDCGEAMRFERSPDSGDCGC